MTRYKLTLGGSIKLTAPGPNGKGFVACTLAAKGPKTFRKIEIADSVAEKFAASIAEYVENGTLVPLGS